MTTLTLKPNINTELLKSIQSQNEYIIQLLEENNQLLKRNKSNDKPKPSRNDIVDNIFKEFAPGNNHNTLIKLVKFISKWSKADQMAIRERLVKMGLNNRHLKSFDHMVANDK